jgi:hypothetical protein
MIERRFQVDQRLLAQRIDRPEQGFVHVGGKILAVGKRAYAERVAIGCEHRDAFADVLSRRAIHDRTESGLELPGPLAGRDDEGAAP